MMCTQAKATYVGREGGTEQEVTSQVHTHLQYLDPQGSRVVLSVNFRPGNLSASVDQA